MKHESNTIIPQTTTPRLCASARVMLVVSVIALLGSFILAGCAKKLQTTTWTGAVTAFYSDEAPEGYGGMDTDNGTIRVGKTSGGGDIFSFVRVPLGVDFFADEITEAKLFLYAAEKPEKLLIGTVNGRWTLYFSTRAEVKALVDNSGLTAAALQTEDDGWVSISVTEMIFRGTGGFFVFNPKGEITRIEFSGTLRDYCIESKR